MNYYKLLEMSYIGGALQPEGTVVQFNDDPKKGGMEPGTNLVPCDENGNEVKRRTPRGAKTSEATDDIA